MTAIYQLGFLTVNFEELLRPFQSPELILNSSLDIVHVTNDDRCEASFVAIFFQQLR